MRELVVISGKGGTGKTSLTASLAKLEGNLVLADCDVDAADLHLLLKPRIRETRPFISGHLAVIDPDRCNNCGLCQSVCRFEAIHLEEGDFRVDPVSCEGCKVCVAICPAKAIDFPAADCGNWYDSVTSSGPMIHARLKPGAENSGKLVSQVRKAARAKAEETGVEWILVDGPPGIGCPVISSITGSSAVLVVTEPTLSGRHDLERVLKLARHFNLPAFVVINKWDINRDVSESIETMAGDNGAALAGKIPYFPEFSEALNQGLTLVEYRPNSEITQILMEIWQYLDRNIKRGET